MKQNIPLILISDEKSSKVFMGMGESLSGILSQKKEYISLAILNTLVYFLMSSAIFTLILIGIKQYELANALTTSALISIAISMLIFLVLIAYPKILSGKKAEQIEKNLLFALKDMTLQVSSGVPLYESIINISKSHYGEVSREFQIIITQVSSGKSLEKALQILAQESSSEFLRRAIWQLINTMHSGGSIKGTLKGIIQELTIEQRNKISNYSRELNMWILVYMLFAVAIPTVGATMLIILSRFGGYSLSEATFLSFIAINIAVEFILIGFVKSRRPIVNV